MKNVLKYIIFSLFLAWMVFTPAKSIAQDSVQQEPKKEKFDAKSFIFGHTGDSYCFHITEIKGEPVCVWLPVIVKCKDGGWHCFSSKHICELKEGETFTHKGSEFYIAPIDAIQYPGKLVELKAGGSLSRPFDISFTKKRIRHLRRVYLPVGLLPARCAQVQERPYGAALQIPRFGGMAHLYRP